MTPAHPHEVTSPRLHRVLIQLEYPVIVTPERGPDFLLRELVLDPMRLTDRLSADQVNLSDADKVLQTIATLADMPMSVVDSLDTSDLLNAIDRCGEIYKRIRAGLVSASSQDQGNNVSKPPFRRKYSA